MPSPEVIQAFGIAVAAIITAWTGRLTVRVNDLEKRLAAVEAERDQFRHLFRVSVRHIRDWMAWATSHAPGTPPPPLPPELVDEV
jgi:hypothetical protein